ncbi:MAG: hypothetical protein HYS80_02530, partial [Candidatus Aenigmarchaeota archaeon]|nr:hypothetical protein [Candidatus Aenigmarchaeota archaeon]
MNPAEQPKPVPVQKLNINRRHFMQLSALAMGSAATAAIFGNPAPVEAAPALEAPETTPLTTDRVKAIITDAHTAGLDLGHAFGSPAETEWNQQPMLDYLDWHDQTEAGAPNDIFAETGAHKVEYQFTMVGKDRIMKIKMYDQVQEIKIPEGTKTADLISLLDIANGTFGEGADQRTQSFSSWIKEWTGSADLTHFVVGSFESGPEGSALADEPFVNNDEVAKHAAIISAAGRHVNKSGQANLGTTIMIADSLPFEIHSGVDAGATPITTDGAIVVAPGKVDVKAVQNHINSLGVSENNTPTEESITVEADPEAPDYQTASVVGSMNNNETWKFLLPMYGAVNNGKYLIQGDNANGTTTVTVQEGAVLVLVTSDSTVIQGPSVRRLDVVLDANGKVVEKANPDGRAV